MLRQVRHRDHLGMRPSFFRKRPRKPRLVTCFTTRTATWPIFSGQLTLAAASVRARCVLAEGCPVVSVHFSFGFARHMGQRTDNICCKVSSASILLLFAIANHKCGQSCCLAAIGQAKIVMRRRFATYCLLNGREWPSPPGIYRPLIELFRC